MEKLIKALTPETASEKGAFQYGMCLRPFSIGTCPDGVVSVEQASSESYERFGRAVRHGILHYDAPLSGQETKDFELPFLIPESDHLLLAFYALEENEHKHFEDYLELLDEEPEHAQERLLTITQRMVDGIIAIENPTGFILKLKEVYEEGGEESKETPFNSMKP